MPLLDLQVNGAKGIDFSDPLLSEAQARTAYRSILAGGTNRFLPTIITATRATYVRNVALLASVARESEFAGRIPGLHLEGPFLSGEPGAVGAHCSIWVCDPDLAWLDTVQQASGDFIAMITLAPERRGACAFISELRRRHIVPALGHSLADYAAVRAAEQAGALLWTHFGNGLPQKLDRHHNPLWAALATDLKLSLVGDGHHLPVEFIQTMLKLKGPSEVILISDASPLCGCAPGAYQLWGHAVQLEASGVLKNPETGYFCGSAYTLHQCVTALTDTSRLGRSVLERMAWENPVQLLNVREA
jgi:N-acetylglucosamine-6-phosphate deacetylase